MGEKKPIVPILCALLAVAVGVIVFLVAGNNKPADTNAVQVPDVVRLDKDDAEKLITNVGLKVGKVDQQNSDDVPEGHVISQDPAAKTSVDEGTEVNLVVSKGKAAPEQVTVPDLKGKTQEEAEKALSDAKLVAVPGNPAYSEDVDPGKVCTQSIAAGTKVDEGSQVIFSVSLGKETVTVPDVTGMSIDDARAALNKAGLGTDTTNSYSDKVDKDKVISQSVAKDTKVVKGTVVTLEVSLGAKPKAKVKVPNIYTYTLEDAKKTLESAGLKYRYTGDKDGTVVAVDPEVGTEVDPGTTVSFTLQNHVTVVAVPDMAGMSGTDARAACDQVGLTLDYDEDNPDKELSGSDPAAGTMVDVGSTVEATYAPDPEPKPEPGAWQTSTDASSKVSSDEEAIFESATSQGAQPESDGSDGDDQDADDQDSDSGDSSSCTAIAVVAKQVTSGTNYAFLGYKDSSWCIFNVSTDADGNASLTSSKTIDVANVNTTSDSAGPMAGGWNASDAEAGSISSDAQSAFDTAASSYTGVSLKPIACLGSQVTNGENYKVLCVGAPTTQDSTEQLYVATIYADPNGGASFSDVSVFDLASYLS